MARLPGPTSRASDSASPSASHVTCVEGRRTPYTFGATPYQTCATLETWRRRQRNAPRSTSTSSCLATRNDCSAHVDRPRPSTVRSRMRWNLSCDVGFSRPHSESQRENFRSCVTSGRTTSAQLHPGTDRPPCLDRRRTELDLGGGTASQDDRGDHPPAPALARTPLAGRASRGRRSRRRPSSSGRGW